MTSGLPSSGTLSINDITIEILRPTGNQMDLGNASVRDLTGNASGQISISNAYSKKWVSPSSANFGYNGAWQYMTVPRYQYITIQVWGPGGGGAGYCGNDGFAYGYCGGCGGGGGTTYAGDTGGVWSAAAYGGGGGCPGSYGGDGYGYGGYVVSGGGYGGGGGSGSGGTGGYVSKTYNWYDAGAPAYYSTIQVYVGGGGGGGPPGESASSGGGGSSGYCTITWS